MRRSLMAVPFVFVVLASGPASGQTLRKAFEGLFVFGECGQPVCLDVSASVHGRHFSAVAEQAGTNMIGFVLQSIGSSLESIPIPSSNAGEVVYFEAGSPVSIRTSAGPIFLERSQTLGRGNLMVGATVGRAALTNLRGQSLEDLTLNFTHEDVGNPGLGDPDFENDVIRVVTSLNLNITALSLFLTYGMGSSVDLGVAIPVVSASLDGSAQAQIQPFQGTSTPHAFLVNGQPSLTSTSTADGSSTGIGDIALRVKANLSQGEAVGFALLTEVRLPTGDEDNFHGTGNTTARIMGVVSRSSGTVSPHLNAGFTMRTGDGNANSVTVRGGLDALLGESVTGSVEFLGDLLVEDPGTDQAVTRTVSYQFPVSRSQRVSEIPDKQDHVMDFVAGIKVQPSERFRVVGSMLVPLASSGVRPDFQWTIGLERIF
jgi:hypothetical protein